MPQSTNRSLDRLGAASGLGAIALLVVSAVTGEMPSPDTPIASIASDVQAHRSQLLLGAYTGVLMSLCLLVFGAVVAAMLRRAEGHEGGWWVVALAGICGMSLWIVASAAAVTFVRAVDHGVRGDVLWIGYGFDHWVGVLALAPLGLFILAASVGGRGTRALARWTTWLGFVSGSLLIAGAGSVTGDEVDGGPLGLAAVAGYLSAIVWIVAVSIRLWRRSDLPAARIAESAPQHV